MVMALEARIIDWTEDDVHTFFSSLGYPQYKGQIRGIKHRFSGDVLCIVDAEGLKDLGIISVGRRLAILKIVYLVKIAHGVPIEDDHYVPPSEAMERLGNISINGLYQLIHEQGDRLRTIEEQHALISKSLTTIVDLKRASLKVMSRIDRVDRNLIVRGTRVLQSHLLQYVVPC
ncbi:hypothetical protein EWM64_g4935 [Hericium alpestre]|uniref:SAM domain-containing protein n=1 Tax=Hericium alpestre TaxID=135208 RepID=A0A4Y9ZWX0_9AGAM|nr:hypothetical protein EWM64_g4935 [Hericium alpestre]